MAVVYRTEDTAKPNDSVDRLDEYHIEINQLIETEFHGLTGSGTEIRRVIVENELSASEIDNLESYLNTAIKLDQQ